jgi:hypothetical protein
MFDQMWKCCQENDIKSLRELILQGNDVNLRDVFSLYMTFDLFRM